MVSAASALSALLSFPPHAAAKATARIGMSRTVYLVMLGTWGKKGKLRFSTDLASGRGAEIVRVICEQDKGH